jgi:hypothetical protein
VLKPKAMLLQFLFRKQRLIFLLILIPIFISLAACSGSKTATREGANRSTTYVRKNYQQIVVYAKVEQTGYRQKIENAMVDLLSKKGYHAIPAYKNFDETYKMDSVKFMEKVHELKVDGVIAFDYLGQQTSVADSYRYNGGMYNYFMTGSAPFDLETTSKQVGYMRLDFYNLDSRASQYNTIVPVKLFNGFDGAVKQLTEDTYTVLKGDRII